MVGENDNQPAGASDEAPRGEEPAGDGGGDPRIAQPDYERCVESLGRNLLALLRDSKEDPRVQIGALVDALSATLAATVATYGLDVYGLLGATMLQLGETTRKMAEGPTREIAEQIARQHRENNDGA